MTRTIAISSQKGGVGKTTTAAHLAAAWGKLGKRVLLVDFDPQYALTRRFGINPTDGHTITHVFAGADDGSDVPVSKATRRDVAQGVDLVPADRRLSSVELNLRDQLNRERILAVLLKDVEGDGYDFIIIDCPPNTGLLTVNALCAADEAVIPVDMQAVDSLMGATELVAMVRQLNAIGERVRVSALVPVRHERRRVVRDAIDEHFKELDLPVAKARIPNRSIFHRSALEQRTVDSISPSHPGTIAYRDLALELLEVPANV